MKIGFFTSTKKPYPVFKSLKAHLEFEVEHLDVLSFKSPPPDGFDLFLVADFGFLMPKSWFNFPKYQTLNIHPSLLPKYRGPAPVQWAIINGETETGLSIMKINKEFDQGDVVYQQKVDININDTTPELYNKIFNLAGEKIGQIIEKYIQGQLDTQSQPEKSPTQYARKLTKKDGFVGWQEIMAGLEGQQSLKIHNLVRGLLPWPGVWSQFKNKKIKILKSHLKNSKLVIDQVQIEGKQPISWQAFSVGYFAN